MGTWRGEGVLLGDLVVRDQGGQGARSVGIGGCLWWMSPSVVCVCLEGKKEKETRPWRVREAE